MAHVLEKKERRLGEKLFLKGDRCVGPKCAMVRRAYPPGVHGKSKRGGKRRGGSEYSGLLHAKQVVRFMYGLDDRGIARYSRQATQSPGIFSVNFLRRLEMRLDNVVFRLGFTDSRRAARQLVGHGHIALNGKRVTIPSLEVKKGDVISFRERSAALPVATSRTERLKKLQISPWLSLNPEKKEGTILRLPEAEETGILADMTKIKEFYSR